MDRINLPQDRGKWRGFFDKIMNYQFAKYVRNFFQGEELLNFPRRILLHGVKLLVT
jgi:hypothetical protein